MSIKFYFAFFFSILLFISACQESVNQESVPLAKQYALPHHSIPSVDSLRYNNACKQWFDVTFGPNGFNGGMLVAQQGEIVFEKYSGAAHLGQQDSIHQDIPFHIASTSKTFTAMSILKLWQDKKIDIEAPYSKYFPEFNYPGVTIRSLLSHRSGLPNYLYFFEQLHYDPRRPIFNKDVLNCLINQKLQITGTEPPNKRFNYCNTNYVLLALLIEKITGKSYPNYIQETIFEPLGMKHSFVFTVSDTSRMTLSYDPRGAAFPLTYLDFTYGDKNIYSTPRDILKWDQLLRTESYLSNATLEAAYTPQSNERPGIKNYGLGWRMNLFPDGNRIIYHNGWWHGNNSVFIRLIKENATIILFGNRYNSAIYHAKALTTIFNGTTQNDNGEE